MSTYKISVGGRGSECFLFPVSDEQYKLLEDGDVENDNMDLDTVTKILNVEDVFDAPQSIIGAYLDEHYITVSNIDGDEIWNSESSELENENHEWKGTEYDNKPHLIIEDYSKGIFFNFFVETEDEFAPSKMTFVITELGDCREIITSIKYDNVDLSDTIEFDDYWSKGFYYILVKY
jgi:hypothetical protein